MDAVYDRVAEEFATVYTTLTDASLDPTDLEVGEVDDPADEAVICLPSLQINTDDWHDWEPERRLEVYIHEAAHAQDYADDHGFTFWQRVADLTLHATDGMEALNAGLDADLDEQTLYRTVIDSVHDGVTDDDVAPETVETYLEDRFYDANR